MKKHYIIGLVAILLLSTIAILLYRLQSDTRLGGAVEVESTEVLETDNLRYTRGQGTIAVVEYLNPSVPLSVDMHHTLLDIQEEFALQVAFATKFFPLNTVPESLRSAGAAECAGDQGKLYEYVDALSSRTDETGDELLYVAARDVELNEARFRTCLEGEEYAVAVSSDAVEAIASGATGVPYLVVINSDGSILRRVSGAASADEIRAMLNELLSSGVVENTDE